MDELRVRVHEDLQTSTMDIDEVASVLDLSTDVVWRYIRAGDLGHIRVQGTEAIEYRILSKDVHDLQAHLHNSAQQTATPDRSGDSAALQLLKRISDVQPRQEQPLGENPTETDPDARPKMTLVRPPAGPAEQAAETVTFASATGPLTAPRTTEGNQPAPSSQAPSPVLEGGHETGPEAATAVAVSLDAGDPATESPAPAAATAVIPPAANPQPAATAQPRPKRPALPPINSIVTVTGSAVHRIAQPSLDQGDAMKMLQSFMESLVAPITAANERLADENTRLLELARMQSQALEKASAERDSLMERLAVLPAEMQKLYERLGTLQAEVHRLEQENQSHAKNSYQKAWGKQGPPWWRRLLNMD
jgi:hypothetical protein